jgi:hypothetical protein
LRTAISQAKCWALRVRRKRQAVNTARVPRRRDDFCTSVVPIVSTRFVIICEIRLCALFLVPTMVVAVIEALMENHSDVRHTPYVAMDTPSSTRISLFSLSWRALSLRKRNPQVM